jgi:DNA (cytosine-5)-methyltransferase 1
MTVFSRLSRFGMTYKPLTESRGEELLTLYLAGFHAKTLVPQEKAQELMENEAECGEKWRASFTKYDPDLSLWKTHQCSLLGDLELFLETWPQWGLMRDGECWEQLTLEQTIRGTEFGLSPNGIDNFYTPNTTGLNGGSNSRKALKKKMEKWATPTTMDKLPPKSQQALHKEATQARPGRSKPANLRDQVSNMENWTKLLPTPNSRDWKDGKTAGNRKSPGLGVIAHQLGRGDGGHLNPTWVEWLMGWPLEWTDLKPLEMDKSHCVPQQLGES